MSRPSIALQSQISITQTIKPGTKTNNVVRDLIALVPIILFPDYVPPLNLSAENTANYKEKKRPSHTLHRPAKTPPRR
jgi:hypothetical protein